MFARGKPLQPSLCFVGKAAAYPRVERCFTWVDSCLTPKHYSIPERLARSKHSSLLQKFVTYGRKSCITLAPGGKMRAVACTINILQTSYDNCHA